VFWGALGAVKDLFDGTKDVQQKQQQQQQQQQQQKQQPAPPPATIATHLDHHAAASLYLRIPDAAAGNKHLDLVTLNP
jgi:transcription initiation factor TFIID subunit TAF12